MYSFNKLQVSGLYNRFQFIHSYDKLNITEAAAVIIPGKGVYVWVE